MKIRNLKRKQGFTIIELMIVLVIIAILLALAYPSYVDYVRKGKRGEAHQLLMNWAVNQEIWRANNPQYAGTGNLAAPVNDEYTFTPSNLGAATYTLTAAAKVDSDQRNDEAKDGTDCDTMTLNQSGVKSPASCWE